MVDIQKIKHLGQGQPASGDSKSKDGASGMSAPLADLSDIGHDTVAFGSSSTKKKKAAEDPLAADLGDCFTSQAK